jgi:hypothetical protein
MEIKGIRTNLVNARSTRLNRVMSVRRAMAVIVSATVVSVIGWIHHPDLLRHMRDRPAGVTRQVRGPSRPQAGV